MRFWMLIVPPSAASALERLRLQRLAVVQTPAQAFQRHFAVHLLQHVEHPARGGIEGGVLAERPALRGENFTTAVKFFSITPGGGDR